MCGRYALYEASTLIFERFNMTIKESGYWNWTPNYNISPGTVVPVVAWNGKRERSWVPMRWGLHPHWKKQAPEGRPLFNARVETAAEKPSFRTPMRRRRALIPANGWYEWEGVEKPKTPYFIREAGQDVTVFAGLWDQWRVDEGITLISATILTTAATGSIKHLHHRMPVRLPEHLWDKWLDWNEKPESVLAQMKSGDDLEFYEVSKTVNSGRSEGPELIKKVS